VNSEITTSAERAAAVQFLDSGAVPETLVSLSQITGLLRAAAEVERAKRPVYIQPSTVPAVTVLPTGAAYAPQQHPGVDIRYSSPAEAAYVVPWAPLRHPGPAAFAWGVRLVYAGVGLLLAGSAGATVTDGNGAAVGACVVGIGAIIGGTARATVEENQREARS
jgi:hypothetical protein